MSDLPPATSERAAAGGSPAARSAAPVWAAVGCYTLWGLLPLMFIATGRLGVSPWEVVAQRSFWSVFWVFPLVLLARQGRQLLGILRSPSTLGWLALSALAIAVNWIIFIWAVGQGHALEASLGYYINPLLNMAVGAALFRERISRVGWAAIALAAVGVAVQAAALGRVPWAGLTLAGSFCLYGVIRKRVTAEAQSGLMVECLLLALPALAYWLWLASHGQARFGHSGEATILLLLTGPATVAPLVMFAWAARRLPLSTLGFIQFIAPTLQFAVGVATGELLTPLRALSFVFIWAGVAVFVWGAARAARPARSLAQSPA